jgi:hypothetical protein
MPIGMIIGTPNPNPRIRGKEEAMRFYTQLH